MFVSTGAALAASRLNRPVRINLDRDQDMWSTGTRHPFKGIYKACAEIATGKIVGLDLELFSNAGFSADLSTYTFFFSLSYLNKLFSSCAYLFLNFFF